MHQPSNARPSMTFIVALLLPLGYVLSDAPVVRLMGGTTSVRGVSTSGAPIPIQAPLCGTTLPIYRPVDWLIDHTFLRQPLLAWADYFGVRGVFAEATLWK